MNIVLIGYVVIGTCLAAYAFGYVRNTNGEMRDKVGIDLFVNTFILCAIWIFLWPIVLSYTVGKILAKRDDEYEQRRIIH